jgi:hypothetical protein
MSVTSINYEEGSKEKDLGYESVNVYYGNGENKDFDSGDFVKDWYDATKFTLHLEDEFHHSNSSSVDHFQMDGAEFDSMYLGFDEVAKVGVLSTQYGDGMELFVTKGTTPTWNELRKLVGDEKIENK